MKRSVLRFCITASILAAGLAAAAAQAAETVRVGIVSNSSDVPFYIAAKKGYFKQEGLDVKLIPFGTASKMVAPLSSGQLDVGGGAPSAGLYNSVSRGLNIKIVADKGSAPPGHGYQALLIRKDLVDSGKVKGIKDLKGMDVSGNGAANANTASLNAYLNKGGLGIPDIKFQSLDFAQQLAALSNKAIAASVTTEPFVTFAVKRGIAVRFAAEDDVYPYHQVSTVLYSGEFIKNRPETAKKFMKAYIRAARYFNDAVHDGHLIGANAPEVIKILTASTKIKDPAIYRAMTVHSVNPNGRVNLSSLKKDFEFFKEHKWLSGETSVDAVVDNSFVDAALKDLGPYKPGH